MKKIIFIIVAMISFISCTTKENNDKHVYLVSFTFPASSILPTGNVSTKECEMKEQYLGIMNDSILNIQIEMKRRELNRDAEKLLEEYASINPNICNHDVMSYKSTDKYVDNIMSEVKSTAKMRFLRSQIGQYVIMVTLSDSLLNSVNGDYKTILKDYDKTYKELCQSYVIYDGTELAAELETEYKTAWYKNELGY